MLQGDVVKVIFSNGRDGKKNHKYHYCYCAFDGAFTFRLGEGEPVNEIYMFRNVTKDKGNVFYWSRGDTRSINKKNIVGIVHIKHVISEKIIKRLNIKHFNNH